MIYLFCTERVNAPFLTIDAFAGYVDQDQTAQNVQCNLWSTLSTWLKNISRKAAMKNQLSRSYLGMKIFVVYSSSQVQGILLPCPFLITVTVNVVSLMPGHP